MYAKRGSILSATLFLDEPYFRQAVVLLTEHNDNGSFGFIINRETDLQLHEILPDIKFQSSIFYGGPVGNENLFYIHELGDIIPQSIEIIPGLYWGGDFEILKDKLNNNEVSSDKVKFFAGYSGWEAGQLEEELKHNSWVQGQAIIKEIMHSAAYEDHWRNMMRRDKEYYVWSNFTDLPHLN